MSEYEQAVGPIIEALKQAASEARSVAELEQLVLEHSRAFSRAALESLTERLEGVASPPRAAEVPGL